MSFAFDPLAAQDDPKRVRAGEQIARVDPFLVRGPKRLALRRAA